MRIHIVIGLAAMLAAAPAIAQVRTEPPSLATEQDDEPLIPEQQQQPVLETNQAGRTASSAVGQVGLRQTRDTAASEAGIEPMARITSRIQNRVQSRIRNRIDRYYDPQANATDPFTLAEEQARTAGRPR